MFETSNRDLFDQSVFQLSLLMEQPAAIDFDLDGIGANSVFQGCMGLLLPCALAVGVALTRKHGEHRRTLRQLRHILWLEHLWRISPDDPRRRRRKK